MKLFNYLRYALVLGGCLLCGMTTVNASVNADDESVSQAANQFRLKAIAPLNDRVSGGFMGTVEGRLVIAGGYETLPVNGNWMEGGFSTEVHFMDPLPIPTKKQKGISRIRESLHLDTPEVADNRSWHNTDLNIRTAYGATTTHGGYMYGAGGITPQGLTDVVFRLGWNGQALVQEFLPPLPQSVAMSAAAVMGNRLYVVGGIDDLANPQAVNKMWVLELNGSLDPSDPGLWKTVDLPYREGVLRPTLTVRRDEVAIADALYVIGGAVLSADGKHFVPQTQAFKFLSADQSRSGWTEQSDAPDDVLIRTSLPIGPAHVLLSGKSVGADGLLLEEILRAGGSDTDARLHTYHVFTNRWVQLNWPSLGLLEPVVINVGDQLLFTGFSATTGTLEFQEATLFYNEKHFTWLDYLAMALYLISLVAIGKYFASRDKDTEYFFLGGRKIPWWAAGLSIYATGTSAISFMAIPAKTYMTDWLYFIGMSIFPFFTLIVAAYLVIPMLRRLEITTVMEYFEMRFGRPVRFLMSFVAVLGQVAGRMSITLLLPSIALTAVTGMDIYLCIIVMGGLATLYTVMGGISAVIWTDVLQVGVLFGGAILSFVLILNQVDGGFTHMIELAVQDNKFNFFDFRPDLTTATIWIMLMWAVADVFGKGFGQEGLQRAFSTPNVRDARRSMITCAVVALPAGFLFYGIGTALYAFYNQRPELLNPTLQNDSIFPLFIAQQLPVGLAGLVISALFAAAMSTLDTAMNSVSAILTRDYFSLFHKNASQKTQMNMAKWVTISCGVIGTGIALYMASFENLGSLWDRFSILLGLIGGGLGGVGALALLTTRANTAGTLLGVILTSAFIYWLRFFAPAIPGLSPLHFFAYGTASLVVGFTTGYIFSVILSGIFPNMAKKDLTGLTLWTSQKGADE